jgi:hypothetical protein
MPTISMLHASRCERKARAARERTGCNWFENCLLVVGIDFMLLFASCSVGVLFSVDRPYFVAVAQDLDQAASAVLATIMGCCVLLLLLLG